MVCGEEGLLKWNREIEGAVDHGAEDGAAAGFVDAETAWCAFCCGGGGVNEGGEWGGVGVRLGGEEGGEVCGDGGGYEGGGGDIVGHAE